MSSLLYGRVAEVIVNRDELSERGKTFRSPPFSIEFEYDFKESGISTASVRLYNPNPETVHKCKYKEKTAGKEKVKIFPKITVIAGFGEDTGTVFVGEIYEMKYKITGIDSVLELSISDQTAKWSNAIINLTYNDRVSGIVRSMASQVGISVEHCEPESDEHLKGFATTTFRESLTTLARVSKSRFFLKEGKLVFESPNRIAFKAINLHRGSGLIGIPEEIKPGRHKVKCLFNHRIRNGSYLKVSWKSILPTKTSKGFEYETKEVEMKAMTGKHKFSSFGESFTEMECIEI